MPAKKKATAKSTRQKPKFRRVLLKISGEVLGGNTGGICPESVHAVAAQVREVARLGVQMELVQTALVKRMPSAARRSRVGVGFRGARWLP